MNRQIASILAIFFFVLSNHTGTTHVVQAGAEFKLLHQNKLDDKFWSSVAISNGRLVLRGLKTVYCIR